ncbi:MAG: hypothetical protein JW838_00780 [Spirochaetes bacterium]|nr:hypothetical protein [Spirochaetota bacterium]
MTAGGNGGRIDRALLNRWQNEKDGRQRFRVYTEEILPRVIDLLREQVEARRREGKIGSYANAVVILGHNPSPALLLAMALRPDTVTILHTPDKKKIIDKTVVPFLEGAFSREAIEFTPLDGMGHGENLRIIERVVKENRKRHRSIVCDITGGKKIMSVQLGIIAHSCGVDISYIDAPRHMESAVPWPGEEVLYLQRPGETEFTEIQAVPYNRLRIGFEASQGRLDFDLFSMAESFRFRQRLGNEKDLADLNRALNERCAAINSRISGDCSSTKGDLEALALMIDRALFPRKLTKKLEAFRGKDLRLILDEEAAAIPWELPLVLSHGIRAPVTRMPHKDEEFLSASGEARESRSGLLLVKGSGEGLTGFDAAFNDIAMRCASLCPMETHEAESRESLRLFLAGRPGVRALVYFGHARFDEAGGEIGWVCRDGSVFGTESLSVFYDSPPEIIIAGACESARASLFQKRSFAYAALRAGCDTYIGATWLLEMERSGAFIMEMVSAMMTRGLPPGESYRAALEALAARFGPGDISLHTYVYYGP